MNSNNSMNAAKILLACLLCEIFLSSFTLLASDFSCDIASSNALKFFNIIGTSFSLIQLVFLKLLIANSKRYTMVITILYYLLHVITDSVGIYSLVKTNCNSQSDVVLSSKMTVTIYVFTTFILNIYILYLRTIDTTDNVLTPLNKTVDIYPPKLPF